MNARRVLPMLIGASLSGCAAAPLYTQATYTPPEEFLATAIPMATPLPGHSVEECKTIMARHYAWVGVTADILDKCTAGSAPHCHAVPAWMEEKDRMIGSTMQDAESCTMTLDAAGVRMPDSVIKAVNHFSASAKRYSKRFGS